MNVKGAFVWGKTPPAGSRHGQAHTVSARKQASTWAVPFHIASRTVFLASFERAFERLEVTWMLCALLPPFQ